MKRLVYPALLFAIGCDLYDDTENAEDTGSGEDFVGDTLERCSTSAPSDAVWISNASIAGDTLTIDVGFGGGCEAHQLQLCWDGLVAESYPMQTWVWVSHNANGDSCEAALSETMTVDISTIGVTPTIVHLEGWGDGLMYE